MKTTKYTVYLGLNDKATKIQKHDIITCYKMAMDECIKYTNGATIYEAKGFYKHEDGSICIENSLRIELLFIEQAQVNELIKALQLKLNQESVVLQVETIESELIY